MELRTIIAVFIGGGLGSVSRLGLARWVNTFHNNPFPLGTFIVNISGCLLIGIFYGMSERFNWLTPDWRIFLTTGFCGGYTTFSTFSYENIQLLQAADYFTFATYSISSFALGLLATFIGISLTKF